MKKTKDLVDVLFDVRAISPEMARRTVQRIDQIDNALEAMLTIRILSELLVQANGVARTAELAMKVNNAVFFHESCVNEESKEEQN